MARVVVLGAGMTGLTTAMLLAHDGHRVSVVERDPNGPPDDPRDAWDQWSRKGPSQFRMLHYMLPRWRHVMQRELPEVLDRLVEAGGAEVNAIRLLPVERTGGWRDDDERFGTVTARRPVLEAAVAQAAAAAPGVEVIRGTRVYGLAPGDPVVPGVPHVTGVVTGQHDLLDADLVVDASGRRSSLPHWLGMLGGQPPTERREPSGFVYYGRHFRGGALPALRSPVLQHHDSVTILTLPADNNTWAFGLAVSSDDLAMRGLRQPDRWTAVAGLYPLTAHWLDAEPITGVDVMAGNEDRRRDFIVDGRPVVTGLVAVGDSWASTNPTLGRGTSMGALHATALRDLLREVSTRDAEKLVLRLHETTTTTLRPWYDQTLRFSSARLAEMSANARGERFMPDVPSWWIGRAMEATAATEPDVLRAALDISGMLALPAEVLGRPGLTDVLGPVAASRPGYALPGPTRSDVLAALTGKAVS